MKTKYKTVVKDVCRCVCRCTTQNYPIIIFLCPHLSTSMFFPAWQTLNLILCFLLASPRSAPACFAWLFLPGAHNKYPKAANWILSGEKQPINIVRGGQAGDCGITTFTLLQGILYTHSAPCFSPVRQISH